MQDYFLGTVIFTLPEQTISELQGNTKELEGAFETVGSLPEPHITLYQAKFPVVQKNAVVEELAQICSQCAAPRFEYVGPNIKNNYIGLAFRRTESLMVLHETIVKTLNPIRSGAIKSVYIERRSEFSPLEQEMIDTRGYPYVFDNYIPHIALVLLANGDDIDRAVSHI
ncbi:MAG: DUF1045 domain-containing protein, partial [Candidatus Absconditabacterales bacterium]